MNKKYYWIKLPRNFFQQRDDEAQNKNAAQTVKNDLHSNVEKIKESFRARK